MHKKPLVSRDPLELHRVATPLELFFDLASVIAVAAAAAGLHHAISENHIWDGLLKYSVAFFGIWWAWSNFTWFASAFDNNDVSYKVSVLFMLSGAVVMAAGVKHFFEHGQLLLPLIGYIIMRIGLVYLWWRVAQDDPDRKQTAWRYIWGIATVQILWLVVVLSLSGTPLYMAVFALFLAELAVPWFAEKAEPTTWHPHHIVERHGLLTIIMLGELLLSLSIAIRHLTKDGGIEWHLFSMVTCGFLLVFSMWWLYFSEGEHVALKSLKTTFFWAYGHIAVFASIAAVGAGLAVFADQIIGNSVITKNVAIASITIPLAIFMVGVWTLHDRYSSGIVSKILLPLFAIVIAVSPLTNFGIEFVAGLLFLCLVIKMLTYGKAARLK